MSQQLALYIHNEDQNNFKMVDYLHETGKPKQILRGKKNNEYKILNENGQLWSLQGNSLRNPISIANQRIKSISTNRNVIHAITFQGLLYAWGEDTAKSGILGLGPVYNVPHPLKVDFLNEPNITLKCVSTGFSHAAALDHCGRLFMWGTGSIVDDLQEPIQVQEIPQLEKNNYTVSCGKKSTMIINGMGQIYNLTVKFNIDSLYDNRCWKLERAQNYETQHQFFVDLSCSDQFAFASTKKQDLYIVRYVGTELQVKKIMLPVKVFGMVQTSKYLYVQTENGIFAQFNKESLHFNEQLEIQRVLTQLSNERREQQLYSELSIFHVNTKFQNDALGFIANISQQNQQIIASIPINSQLEVKSAINPLQNTQNKLNFISSYNRIEKTQFTTPSKLTGNPNQNSASQNMFQSLYQIKQSIWDSPSNQKQQNEPRTPKSYLYQQQDTPTRHYKTEQPAKQRQSYSYISPTTQFQIQPMAEEVSPRISFIDKYIKTPEPKRINHRIKPCGSLINQLLNAIAAGKQNSEDKQSDPPQQPRSTSQNAEMVQALLDTLGSNSQKRNRSAENAKIAEVFNKKSNYDMKLQEEMQSVRQKIHGLQSYDLAPNYYEHTKKISLLDGSTLTVDGSLYDKDGDLKVQGYAKIKGKDGTVLYYEDYEYLPIKPQKVKLNNGKTIEVESDTYDDEGHLIVKGMKKIKQRGNKIVYAKDEQCEQLKLIEMNDRRKIYVDCNTYDKDGHLKIKGKRKILLNDGTVLYYNSTVEDVIQETHEVTLYNGDTIKVLSDTFDKEGDVFIPGKKKVKQEDDETVYVSDSTYPELKSIETIDNDTIYLHSHVYDEDGDIFVNGKLKLEEGYINATDPWNLKKMHQISLEKGGTIYIETNFYDSDGDPIVKGKKKITKNEQTYYVDKVYYPQLKPITLTDGRILLTDSNQFDKENDLRVEGKTKIKTEDGIVMYADFDDPQTEIVQIRLESGQLIQVVVDQFDQQGDPIVSGKSKVISKEDGEIFYADDPNLPQLQKITLMDNSELYVFTKLFDKVGDPIVKGKIKVRIDNDSSIYVDSESTIIPEEVHIISIDDRKSIEVECSTYDSEGDLLVKGKAKYKNEKEEIVYLTLDQESLTEITMIDQSTRWVDSDIYYKNGVLKVRGKNAIQTSEEQVLYYDQEFEEPLILNEIDLENDQTIQYLGNNFDQDGNIIIPGKCKINLNNEIFYINYKSVDLNKIKLIDETIAYVDNQYYDSQGDPIIPGKIKVSQPEIMYQPRYPHPQIFDKQEINTQNDGAINVQVLYYDEDVDPIVPGKIKIFDENDQPLYIDVYPQELKTVNLVDETTCLIQYYYYDSDGDILVPGLKKIIGENDEDPKYDEIKYQDLDWELDSKEIKLDDGTNITAYAQQYDQDGDLILQGMKKYEIEEGDNVYSNILFENPPQKIRMSDGGEVLVSFNQFDKDGDIILPGYIKKNVKGKKFYQEKVSPIQKQKEEITLESGETSIEEYQSYDYEGDPIIKGKLKIKYSSGEIIYQTIIGLEETVKTPRIKKLKRKKKRGYRSKLDQVAEENEQDSDEDGQFQKTPAKGHVSSLQRDGATEMFEVLNNYYEKLEQDFYKNLQLIYQYQPNIANLIEVFNNIGKFHSLQQIKDAFDILKGGKIDFSIQQRKPSVRSDISEVDQLLSQLDSNKNLEESKSKKKVIKKTDKDEKDKKVKKSDKKTDKSVDSKKSSDKKKKDDKKTDKSVDSKKSKDKKDDANKSITKKKLDKSVDSKKAKSVEKKDDAKKTKSTDKKKDDPNKSVLKKAKSPDQKKGKSTDKDKDKDKDKKTKSTDKKKDDPNKSVLKKAKDSKLDKSVDSKKPKSTDKKKDDPNKSVLKKAKDKDSKLDKSTDSKKVKSKDDPNKNVLKKAKDTDSKADKSVDSKKPKSTDKKKDDPNKSVLKKAKSPDSKAESTDAKKTKSTDKKKDDPNKSVLKKTKSPDSKKAKSSEKKDDPNKSVLKKAKDKDSKTDKKDDAKKTKSTDKKKDDPNKSILKKVKDSGSKTEKSVDSKKPKSTDKKKDDPNSSLLKKKAKDTDSKLDKSVDSKKEKSIDIKKAKDKDSKGDKSVDSKKPKSSTEKKKDDPDKSVLKKDSKLDKSVDSKKPKSTDKKKDDPNKSILKKDGKSADKKKDDAKKSDKDKGDKKTDSKKGSVDKKKEDPNKSILKKAESSDKKKDDKKDSKKSSVEKKKDDPNKSVLKKSVKDDKKTAKSTDSKKDDKKGDKKEKKKEDADTSILSKEKKTKKKDELNTSSVSKKSKSADSKVGKEKKKDDLNTSQTSVKSKKKQSDGEESKKSAKKSMGDLNISGISKKSSDDSKKVKDDKSEKKEKKSVDAKKKDKPDDKKKSTDTKKKDAGKSDKKKSAEKSDKKSKDPKSSAKKFKKTLPDDITNQFLAVEQMHQLESSMKDDSFKASDIFGHKDDDSVQLPSNQDQSLDLSEVKSKKEVKKKEGEKSVIKKTPSSASIKKSTEKLKSPAMSKQNSQVNLSTSKLNVSKVKSTKDKEKEKEKSKDKPKESKEKSKEKESGKEKTKSTDKKDSKKTAKASPSTKTTTSAKAKK